MSKGRDREWGGRKRASVYNTRIHSRIAIIFALLLMGTTYDSMMYDAGGWSL